MVNGISSSDPRGLNKGRGSKFSFGSRVWQGTPEEDRCEYNNEDNSPKTIKKKTLSGWHTVKIKQTNSFV